MFGKLKNSLVWVVWKTLPSCKDVTALISRSMENDLSFRERITMKIHLWSCLACNRYFSQIRFMSEVIQLQEKKIEKGETSPILSADASKRLKETLKSSKFLVVLVLLNSINV